ncbi:hypothetical protein FIBSPDRAFT_750634 [Athelia psychrophila]|uniref:Uncharacterized protein n=1 Tax=Athelia psychrophila TaxID=1759441 RepID=A0A166DZQ6_9AGAM|nr:hypothetical protein FIBSPDRAFT_750634 [Fibularhizoctonia sp. CBS 109695]
MPKPSDDWDWPTTWAYVLPAIDHVMRSTSNADDGSPPKISIAYSMGIYTTIYNYSTGSRMHDQPDRDGTWQGRMAKIGVALDQHCCETVLQLLSEAPEDPSELMRYVIGRFGSYNARASVVGHRVRYYDRQYVAWEVGRGRGWLKVEPEDAARIKEKPEAREALERLQLKQWGFREGSTKGETDIAEARAEAGTSPNQIVKVGSIALRRFRSMFIEPLLGVDEGGKQEGEGGIQSTGAQGKLASAIEKALEAGGAGLQDEVNKLADIFRRIGMRPDNPWVLKLENHFGAAPTE